MLELGVKECLNFALISSSSILVFVLGYVYHVVVNLSNVHPGFRTQRDAKKRLISPGSLELLQQPRPRVGQFS
jgi:hypothetical protein